MNNKFLKIFIPIIVVLLIATLAFVITSNIFSNKEKNESFKNNNDGQVEQESEENQPEVNKPEEKNVVLNSKIGLELLSKIEMPINYSNNLFNILKSEGISNSYMLLYTYALINTNYDYHLLLKTLDDYSGNYILKSDFESVAKSYFGKDLQLKYNDIIFSGDYDSKNERYNIVATGYATDKLEYVIQVPYEIKEINNEYFISCYEIYASNSSEFTEENIQSYNEIFYDSNRSKKIERITNTDFEDSNKQLEYIREKIEDGSIKKEDLESITYVLQKEEGTSSYIIKSIK